MSPASDFGNVSDDAKKGGNKRPVKTKGKRGNLSVVSYFTPLLIPFRLLDEAEFDLKRKRVSIKATKGAPFILTRLSAQFTSNVSR